MKIHNLFYYIDKNDSSIFIPGWRGLNHLKWNSSKANFTIYEAYKDSFKIKSLSKDQTAPFCILKQSWFDRNSGFWFILDKLSGEMSVLLDQIKGISWYSWFISDKSVRGAPTVFDTVDHNTGIKSWEIEKWIKSLNMTSKSGHEVNPASWIRRKCPINVRYYGNWPIQRISTQFVSALHLEPIKKEIWLVLFWQIFILQITHRIGRWTGAKIIFRLGHGPFEGILELKTPRKCDKIMISKLLEMVL